MRARRRSEKMPLMACTVAAAKETTAQCASTRAHSTTVGRLHVRASGLVRLVAGVELVREKNTADYGLNTSQIETGIRV